jgi:Tfp pilus assembly protein PilF
VSQFKNKTGKPINCLAEIHSKGVSLPICKACKYEVIDRTTVVCPNCGTPFEPAGKVEPAVEVASSQSAKNTSDPEDRLEICDPGDLLGADQPLAVSQARPVREPRTPVASTTRSTGDSPPANATDADDKPIEKIHKLTEEEVLKIRSRLLKAESEYVTPEDASSIISDLSKQRREHPSPDPHDDPKDTVANGSALVTGATLSENHKAAPEPAEPPGSPGASSPLRRIAYFHKNFVQLTGSIHPVAGEELIIGDRRYLLKPKRIKPEYKIAAIAAVFVILLIIVGKQFLSPTLPGSGTVVGMVLDSEGRPVASNVEVALPEAGKKTRSDALGFFRFDQVPTGAYAVRVTLPGGKIGTDNISIVADQITTISLGPRTTWTERPGAPLSATLPPPTTATVSGKETSPPSSPSGRTDQTTSPSNKEYATLKLAANVDEATVTVDGKVLGVGNLSYKKLTPGKHDVTVTKNGFGAWKGQVQLKANETHTLSVTLAPMEAGTAETAVSAEALYQSGRAQLAAGNTAGAIDDLTKAIVQKPSMADAYAARAETYQLRGDITAADSDYVRAGEIYAMQDRVTAAQDMFTKALNINARSIPAMLNRADLYARQEDKTAAIKEYQAVLRLDEFNFRANYDLGKLYFASGDNKEADKRLRKAQEINPKVPEVYHYLMLNYFARDDFKKVKKAYTDFKLTASEEQIQAFRQNPRFEPILRVIGEYERP